MNRIFKMTVMIFALIILDQLTKAVVQQKFALGESITIIDGFFNFTYVRNPGAAWGMGANSSDWIRIPLFFVIPVFACFGFMWAIWTTRNQRLITCSAYSLILSGAIGNLIDRFTMNYVVDFFDFYIGTSHFPAFNIADSAITIGAILIVIDVLFFEKREKEIVTDNT